MTFRIPLHEIRFEFSRASGKGGQNVNKVETRVQAFWHVQNSGVFSVEQKERITHKLHSSINLRGEVMVTASSQRSQMQNREAAVVRLNALVKKALALPKKRKFTKPTRASTIKRLEQKSVHSRKKVMRRSISQSQE